MYSTRSKLLLALAAALLADAAFADPAPKSDVAPVDVDFKGGTLDEYVGLLRKQWKDAKIVVDGVGGVQLPKSRLPTVTLPLAVRWIQKTSAARNGRVILETATSPGAPGEVYVFTSARTPGSAPTPQPAADHEVKPYLLPAAEEKAGGGSPGAIRKAIEAALKKQQPPSKASVEYDPETRMLCVAGTRSDVQLADRVVETMTRGRRVEAALSQIQADIDKLKADVSELKRRATTPPAVN